MPRSVMGAAGSYKMSQEYNLQANLDNALYIANSLKLILAPQKIQSILKNELNIDISLDDANIIWGWWHNNVNPSEDEFLLHPTRIIHIVKTFILAWNKITK